MPDAIEVRKIPLKNVSDASGFAELIEAGVLEADRVIAVIGKTEGNGGVNDYTRIIADRAFREVLMAKGTRGRGRHEAGRHHRSAGRALRADQDAPADDPHHPRREEPREDRVDGEHARVDGPLQWDDGPRHRGRTR